MISFTYFLEANICLLFFMGLYRVGFQRLTFFDWNRFYLLGGLVSSLFIPFMDLPTLNWGPTQSTTIIQLVTKAIPVSAHSTNYFPASSGVSLISLLIAFYWLLVSYYLSKLAIDVRSVVRLAKRNHSQSIGSLRIIWVPDTMPIGSFFHYIFLHKGQLKGEAIGVAIRHEQVHAQQLHTLDWLFVRMVSALFWFNPLMRQWQQAITINHEYIADSTTVESYDATRYAHLLVSLAAHPGFSSLLHYFSSGQLKSRITMIHQLRSKAVQRLRFLLVAPLLGLLLFIVSCEQSASLELARPSFLPKGAYLFKDLIGSWTNTDRTTINANDGQTPRDFPERGGDVRACLSNLVLGADGRFQMRDERSGQTLQGTWQSDPVGVSVQLHYLENPSSTDVIYNRDGSIARGPFVKTIALDVTSLRGGKLEAWQSYGASGNLSSGQVYYQYQKN